MNWAEKQQQPKAPVTPNSDATALVQRS